MEEAALERRRRLAALGNKDILAEEPHLATAEETAQQIIESVGAPADFCKAASKKIDWDLKEEYRDRLALLEDETAQAINHLVRTRLAESANDASLDQS